MITKFFECTFLSDIVLNSNTATEEQFKSLDYIPGANFLGIVAKHYDELKDNAFDIFHSGKVRFGDAHIAINNERSLKMPVSWFYEKGDEDKKEIYIHHKITDKMHEEFTKKGKQLKQIRTGFFDDDKVATIPHSYSLKSAYDREKRSSKEEQMYGYDALQKGSKWIFYIEADDENLLNKVTDKIVGKHNIGRSKTAQYGRVEIEMLDNYNNDYKVNNSDELIIYFESCAAFMDEFGEPTFQPLEKDLLLETGNINWEKSQIRTKSFAPWNYTRKTRDADRVCIDKGSVIIIENENISPVEFAEKVKYGIGLYKNEGFGKVLINPDFLIPDENANLKNPPQSTKNADCNQQIPAIVETDESDKIIIDFLSGKQSEEDKKKIIIEATNKFVSKYGEKWQKSISSSQWGAVREIAQRITDYTKMMKELFSEDKDERGIKGGFLMHGKSEQKWKNKYKDLKVAIENVAKNTDEKFARKFLVNLCSQMAKIKEKKEVNNVRL